MPGKNQLKGAAQKGRYTAKNGVGDITNPKYTVFPILRQDSEERCSLVGTGFFICDNGIFVSAKHVFEDVIDDRGHPLKPLFIVQFLPENIYIPRYIERGIVRNGTDVGIGILKPLFHAETGELLENDILKLTTEAPKIGQNIVTYAYPNTRIELKGLKQDIYFYPDYYAGELVDYFPNGRDRTLLPGPCYQTSIIIHGGASGGPVSGTNGRVFGINSTGFFDDNVSFVSRIDEILDVAIYPVSILGNEPSSISIGELAELGYVILYR